MKNGHGHETLESMSQAVWYNQWTLRKFDKYLSGNILEVGCGIGSFTRKLTDFGKVFAIDIVNEYVEKTSKLLGSRGEVGFGDIETAIYFFKNQKFNSIVCLNVLEHIKDDRQALKNLYNLLEEKGYLILLVPAHQFLFGKIDKSIGHFRRYDKKNLVNTITQIGFKIKKFRSINMFGAFGWFLSSKVFSESKVDKIKIKTFDLLAPFILSIEDIVEPPFGTSILVIAQR